MAERRKFPRVELKRSFLWRGTGTLDNLDAVENVSEGGIAIGLKNQELKPKDIVQFEFQLPTGKVVHSKAQVRWAGAKTDGDGFRAGMEFSDISDKNRHEIRCFVGKCRYDCE